MWRHRCTPQVASHGPRSFHTLCNNKQLAYCLLCYLEQARLNDVYIRDVLPFIEQLTVLSDLLFQPDLDAEESLVLLVLILDLAFDTSQFCFQWLNQDCNLLQLQTIAAFSVVQAVLQGLDLILEAGGKVQR